MPTTQRVRALDNEDDKTFPVEVAAVELDNLQLRLKFANYIRFQADIGAQCNVIPFEMYKQATGDFSLTQVSPSISNHSIRRQVNSCGRYSSAESVA